MTTTPFFTAFHQEWGDMYYYQSEAAAEFAKEALGGWRIVKTSSAIWRVDVRRP